MSSIQDVILGAAALNMPRRKDKKKKKITRKPAKKGLYIFMDESKFIFSGWEDVAQPWNFSNCEAYIEWCHISRGFLHYRYKYHCKVDKANLHYYKLPVFKEQWIKMCQHIYDTLFLECNKCPLSILQMVYV
jgi:hypothetical protein